MPLVFVHGVNTRKGPKYEAQLNCRNALFREFLGETAKHCYSPYWGDLGGKFSFGLKCLPYTAESFGSDNQSLLNLIAQIHSSTLSPDADCILVSLAKTSLVDAVDLLWGAFAVTADGDPGEMAAMAAMGCKALNYALSHQGTSPDWVGTCKNDLQFVDKLLRACLPDNGTGATAKPEAFGVSDFMEPLGRAASALGDAAAGFLQGPVASAWYKICKAVRPWANESAAKFVGDALAYLRTRDVDDPNSSIAKVVKDSIVLAAGHRSDADPLVIVGHSMGGNICYDLLANELESTLTCDLFITVGSQVGLFEELQLFASSPTGSVQNRPKVASPSCVKRWINVYDPMDILAYSAASIFDGVQDFQFKAGALDPFSAHSMYFYRPLFFQRLRDHIAKA